VFRYFALCWNPQDPHQETAARIAARRLRASSGEWQLTVEMYGLMVLHAGLRAGSSETYLLTGDRGVVLGKLFATSPAGEAIPTSIAELDANASQSIIASAGARLIERYWGRYVAFLRDPSTRVTRVVRDPTAAMPCFFATFRGVTLFFSRAEDCASLYLLQFSINWPYIGAFLCIPALQTRQTGVDEITELQPGECLQLDSEGARSTKLYWDPIRLARSNAIEDVGEAIESVRDVTRSCVWAWSSCYPRIIHLLSGGLDSSIILSCLRSAPARPDVTCVNYFSKLSSEMDEREFARLAATAADCELIEYEDEICDVRLESILDFPRTARIWSRLYHLQHSGFEGKLAAGCRASAIFRGIGGDQLFCQGGTTLAVVDHLYERGLRHGFFEGAARAARREKISLWSVLNTAVRMAWFASPWMPEKLAGEFSSLVPPAVIAATKANQSFAHPWLPATRGVAPGKLWQIFSISNHADFYDPLARPDAPERVAPLLSQPLMETCLRIPTYILNTGGRDRAIARLAFEQELPREIFSRRTKGLIDSFLMQILSSNLSFVRELMLDGILVKEGLLDRRRVETVLADRHSMVGPEAAELVAFHLSTEAWLRSWIASGQRAAA
jgi:asparagine synthase (glutamine-hydrolysing)